jgi:hypothetical protein
MALIVAKNPTAVSRGRTGCEKGGPAGAGKTTPGQRSDSARKAEAKPTTGAVDTSKRALHLCLRRIKDAENKSELHRLTEELQRILFRRR